MTARNPLTPDLSNRARGRWGEDLAAGHYRRLGYEILDRNWRSPTGELDLIVRIGGTIVFSEVKARRTADFGPAASAVDRRQAAPNPSTRRRVAARPRDARRLGALRRGRHHRHHARPHHRRVLTSRLVSDTNRVHQPATAQIRRARQTSRAAATRT